MPNVFMAFNASIFEGIGPRQYRCVCSYRRRTNGFGEQIIMTVQTSCAWYTIADALAHFPAVIFAAKVMFVSILQARMSFCPNVREISVF